MKNPFDLLAPIIDRFLGPRMGEEFNPPSTDFNQFFETCSPAKRWRLYAGWPVIVGEDKVYCICRYHGPYVDLVRGFPPFDRKGQCPCCEKHYQINRNKFGAEHGIFRVVV